MKVTYTGRMDVGGSGIGTTAWHQVKPLIEENLLERVYAPAGKKVPEKLLTKIPDINAPYIVGDIFFDGYTSLTIEKYPEILQTWGNHCLYQFREFPKAKKIVNLYSAHPIEQDTLMRGEPNYVSSADSMKKQIKELELADYIFIPSEFVYNSLVKHKLQYKAKIVPFGVDLEKFKPRETPKEDDKFQIMFVGQNWLRKGLIYLLTAFKKLDLKNAELIVAGVQDDLGKAFPLENVKFGWVPDLVKAYQDSDVFVLPAIEDGCPLAVYEAMACGVPPIVTDTNGTAQHIYNGQNGFIIPPKSVDAIMDTIKSIYDNRDLGIKMGHQARKTAEAFPWERHEQEYVKFIKSIT